MKRQQEDIAFLIAIGKALKSYRTLRLLTQERLGELAGVNPKYIGELERGEKNPTAIILRRIALAYNISIAELFNFASVDMIK